MDIIGVVHPVFLAWKDRGDGEGCERKGRGGEGRSSLPHGPGGWDLSQYGQGLPLEVFFILYISHAGVWRRPHAISYRAWSCKEFSWKQHCLLPIRV